MIRLTDWRSAEAKAQEVLRLVGTPGSGNQWYAKGDSVGTDSGNLLDLMVETKSTQNKSYSVRRDWVAEYRKTAMMVDKVFALHIQFQKAGGKPQDYILLELGDFAEMINKC